MRIVMKPFLGVLGVSLLALAFAMPIASAATAPSAAQAVGNASGTDLPAGNTVQGATLKDGVALIGDDQPPAGNDQGKGKGKGKGKHKGKGKGKGKGKPKTEPKTETPPPSGK